MIGVLAITTFVIAEAVLHWYIIEGERKDPKDNDAVMLMRTFVYVVLAMALAGPKYHWSVENLMPVFGWLLFILITRWALFDYLLNWFRGKPWHYLGHETPDDIIELRINPKVLLIMKLSAYVTAIIIALIL